MRFTLSKLLALILVTACSLSPKRGKLPPVDPEGENIKKENPTNEPPSWQELTFTIVLAKPESPGTEVVGYDQVFKILQREEHGPCVDCHANTWPYLGKDLANPWGSLTGSVGENGYKDVKQLADLILGCIDSEDQNHCLPTPDKPNLTKMPDPDYYDAVEGEELRTVKAWVEGGAQEKSSVSTVEAPKIAEVKIADLPADIAIDIATLNMTQATWEITAKVKAKPGLESCSSGSLSLVISDGADDRTVPIILECEGKRLKEKYIASTSEPF
ncbi:MAG: hypothetical protein AB7T49_15395 [Oligoflexales bacterium]